MLDRGRELHAQWAELDELARDREQALMREWHAFFDSGGSPPPREQVAAVRELRERAATKLQEFVAYISAQQAK